MVKRVLVCGGRDFQDVQMFMAVMNKYRERFTYPYDPCGRSAECYMQIISGMAKGADMMAARYAKAFGLKLHEFPADWDKHGKAAGVIRNQQMIDEGRPDLVIAFPGGTGTNDMVGRARRANIEVIRVG